MQFDRFIFFLVKLIPSWITPNHLSAARVIIFLPVAILFWRNFNFLALGFFVFGLVLDILDGALARHRKIQSKTGEWLDPCTDKVLVLGLILIFGWRHFSAELIWAIVAVELLMVLMRPVKIRLGKSAKANNWGKAKMWCLSAAVIGVILAEGWSIFLANIALWLALGCVIAGLSRHILDLRNH